MYRALLKSALEHGLSPAVEDERGRNALFVLCEQMSSVSSELCPDSTRLMHIVLDGCGSAGVGGSDRTGRTVFDIDEKVPHSCLSACRQILLDSANHHRTIPLRSSSNRPPAAHPQQHGGGGDWEYEKPHGSSSLGIAASYGARDDHQSNGHLSVSALGGDKAHRYPEVAKRRTVNSSASYTSSVDTSFAQQRHLDQDGNGSVGSREERRKRPPSYLEDDDDEDDSSLASNGLRPQPLAGSRGSGFGSSGNRNGSSYR